MLRTPAKRLSRALCLALLSLAALCAGCGDGTTRENYTFIPFDTLLPASTRGLVQLAHTGQSGGPWDSLQSADSSWRNHPADLIRYYTGGIELDAVDELLLAQVSTGGDEFLLLLHLDAARADGAMQSLQRTEAAAYRGQPVSTISASGLSLAPLNRTTWGIGKRSAVEAMIDVYQDAAPGFAASALAPYSGSRQDDAALYFAYALPALYGDVASPGSGAHSLNGALAVRGNLDWTGDSLAGAIEVVSGNAQAYTTRLLQLVPEAAAGMFAAQDGVLRIDAGALPPGNDLQSLVKSLVIGMNAVDYTEAVQHGGNPPWLNFNVGRDPNSIFINFEFLGAAQRSAFEAEHLPAGFTLAPLRILASDTPRYYLVLNVYQSSGGLVEGARAEWSVFVNDPETGQPRFLVIQAAAEALSADSVRLLTLPEPVSHDLEPDAIVSYVGVIDEASGEESPYFSSRIRWPQGADTHVRFAREFVVANDYIFWGNAVADRGLYNASVHNRAAVRVPAGDITLRDDSRWAEFITAEPVHTLVYLNPLDIVVSPWWNLDEPYLDVTAAYRQQLIDFKNNFYPDTVRGVAEEAMRGEKDALISSTTGETALTTYLHFPLHDPHALLQSVGAADLPPAAIVLRDGEAPQHLVTLAISARSDDPCGLRADWMTYFLDERGRPGSLLLEPLSSDACIHPVSLLGLPASIMQSRSGNRLGVTVTSAFTGLKAELELDRAQDSLPGLDWIEAGDRVCALNGVCDAAFYDGRILEQPLRSLGPGAVSVTALTTPWDGFIGTRPVAAGVRALPAIMAVNPWVTVPPVGVLPQPN